ncbi:MAG: SpoIIE family protein phosphatase [Chloroflexota bacterium]
MQPIPFSSIPLFKTLAQEDLTEIGESLRLKVLKDGEILFHEDETGDSLYVILLGELEVIKALGTPEERKLNLHGQGSFLGEMSLLTDNNKRTASVRGLGETHLLELRRDRFEELIEKRPSIAYHMVRELSARLRSSDEAMIKSLRVKNEQLAKAYEELKAAQAELIQKEKLEAELNMARKIQTSILPQEINLSDCCEFGAKMVPARAVGGDFYDIIPLPDGKIGLAIGDVSDKGVAAAMFMAQFCTLLRVEAKRCPTPAEALTRVNNALLESNTAGMFVTAIYGVYDPKAKTFCYARAGHEVPVIFDPKGEFYQPEHDQGSALCVFPDPLLDEQTVKISKNSTLMMYTDGGTDAMNTDESFFGLENLKQTFSAQLDKSPQELCEIVIDTLLEFQEEDQFDDATLVALRPI